MSDSPDPVHNAAIRADLAMCGRAIIAQHDRRSGRMWP